MSEPIVDWSKLRKYGDQTIYCRCGYIYRSLCKAVLHEGNLIIVTEKACPSCGNTLGHVKQASSDVESWTL